MKTFRTKTFVVATIAFGLLMIPSFLAAFGQAEGTLSNHSLWSYFVQLFLILRFPTHTLFWNAFVNNGANMYFMGLIVNCLFYGLLTERVLTLFSRKEQKEAVATQNQ